MSVVVRQFHDDWLLWNVYADGSIREFMTECWPEHGTETNWPAVMREAARNPQAGRLLRFAVEVPGIEQAEFFSALNLWCEKLGDSFLDDSKVYAEETEAA